jgi:hypothetical protein
MNIVIGGDHCEPRAEALAIRRARSAPSKTGEAIVEGLRKRAETRRQAQLQSPTGVPLTSDILPDRTPF